MGTRSSIVGRELASGPCRSYCLHAERPSRPIRRTCERSADNIQKSLKPAASFAPEHARANCIRTRRRLARMADPGSHPAVSSAIPHSSSPPTSALVLAPLGRTEHELNAARPPATRSASRPPPARARSCHSGWASAAKRPSPSPHRRDHTCRRVSQRCLPRRGGGGVPEAPSESAERSCSSIAPVPSRSAR